MRFFTIHSFDDRPDIRTAATRALLDHLAAGRIKPLIHARLPLAEAAAPTRCSKRRGHRQDCDEAVTITLSLWERVAVAIGDGRVRARPRVSVIPLTPTLSQRGEGGLSS